MTDWGHIGHGVERILMSQKGLCEDFVFNGRQYWGCRSRLGREDVNTDAGLLDAYRFSLLCPAGQFAGQEPPRPRVDKIMVDGVEYRVLECESDAVNATIRIHLGGALA